MSIGCCLFCGQALAPLPSMQTRKAVAGDSFDWCVCVCARACGLRSLVLRMIYWLLAGGRECGATADDAEEGSFLQQLRIAFPARFGAQALRRTTLTRPSEPAALTGLYIGAAQTPNLKEDFSVIATHACKRMCVEGSRFGAEKP